MREQCSLGTGPNNKTPKECGAKLITVGAGMPTVYWAEAQIRSMSTVLRDMWREPILDARQLKYECSLSEGTTPARCEAMVVEDGGEAHCMARRLVGSETKCLLGMGQRPLLM